MSNSSKRHANQRNPKKRTAANALAQMPRGQAMQSQPTLPGVGFGAIGPTRTRTSIQVTQQFRGPIPDPATLAEYDDRFPGLADRIVTMAEKEQGHRHAIVEKAVDANIAITKRGQLFGFVVALAGMGLGTWAMIQAPNAWTSVGGGVLGGGSLLGLVALFVQGRKENAPPDDDGAPPPKKRKRRR